MVVSLTTILETSPLFSTPNFHQPRDAAKIAEAKSKRASEEAIIRSMRQKIATDDGDMDSQIQRIAAMESKLTQIPIAPTLYVQDITPEKLGELLQENGERLAGISDEAGIFDILAGRYSDKPNLDLFLKAHSGSVHKEHRRSREPVDLKRPSLTLAISPQPSVLREIGANGAFQGRGLLARGLFALPNSLLGYRSLDPDPMPENVLKAYNSSVTSLLNRGVVSEPLQFTKDGFKYWLEFSQWLEPQFREGGDLETLAAWGGKLPGAAARIAGLFHCAATANENTPPLSIDDGLVLDALEVAKALIPHAKAVWGLMGADPSLENAKRVLRWIERKELRRFTVKDCQDGLRSRFPRVEALKTALDILTERYFIRPIEGGPHKRGRPSSVYEVNPSVNAGGLQ